MDKRYQVFVSSTFADLKAERQRVIQALMEMDCIPAGMELFPASDDEQWEFIKRVIDDCDYYILILGGRYGSLNESGISYTEMEFDYAQSIGLKVLSFVHRDPGQIPLAKSEIDSSQRAKYDAFRAKVTADRLVKFWDHETELPGMVTLSLNKTMKIYPAVGWIRGDKATSEQSLERINALQAENAKLKDEAASAAVTLRPHPAPDIAGLEESFNVKYSYSEYYRQGSELKNRSFSMTWREIFYAIAPELIAHPSDSSVGNLIANYSRKKQTNTTGTTHIDEESFGTIKVQLMALNLVDVSYVKTVQGGMGVFWSLTEHGRSMMTAVRIVKSKERESELPQKGEATV
ncbi:DUF4062 domain-containing protein [Mesorhizobium sp. B2-1-3A]|uniref:DUF4062 domain-containing protein n=1 Tax=Mesorhizobium sp. B2-1-3A TaxID=2589971 RepID=UPI00112E1DA2|nr:DUF4062 domain-containing protein [Mesorhizobium sp. B2-1-3A]TPM90946.1 DUF4062 domain-containing protein [Mesorhizobium sp. B2-1-3A]